jgi:hypothetical protein
LGIVLYFLPADISRIRIKRPAPSTYQVAGVTLANTLAAHVVTPAAHPVPVVSGALVRTPLV